MSLTRYRTAQYIGLILGALALAIGYWYFSVRAGVGPNSSVSQSQGTGRLDSGLTAYFALDENTGTAAADSSTNAIASLTLTNGPTWTTAQIGSGITFDGTDDYATTADTATLDFADTEDLTITGWFNRSTFTTDDTIIAKRNGIAAADQGYLCYISAADALICEVSDATDEYSVTSASTFTATGWNHFAFVWDQDSATGTELYINGAANGATDAATTTLANVGTLANAVAFRLGAESDNGVPFAGSLDEARVYDRALSGEEIANLYRLTTPTGVDTGLKGYWSFNAQDMYSTTTAYDRSGARNTGTLNSSPPKVPGKLGQALNFDGSADYVDAGSGTTLDDIVDLTACAWIYPETTPGGTFTNIFSKETGGGAGWYVYIDDSIGPAGLHLAFYRNFQTTHGEWYAPSGAVPLSTWSHFCVTYNNSSVSNIPVMYVNGNSVNVGVFTTPVGLPAVADGTASLRLGSETGTNFFDGSIDEVRVYNRLLSAGEIKALYDTSDADKVNSSISQSQGTGRLDSGLTAYFALDENTGTAAADSSTNAIASLTLTNGPTWTTAQIGSGITFDGTDDYATTADTATLDFADTEDITITGWFNRSTFTTDDTIIAKRNGIAAADQGYLCYISAADAVICEVSDATDEYSVTSASTFTATGWNHFAFVWDQDSATGTELYINGAPNGATDTGTIGNIGTLANAVAFRLGAESDNGVPFAGSLDEARVYDRVLSGEEIANLYRITTPTGVDTGLKGYWSFNAQDMYSTTTAYDRSGARNTGTLTNGPVKAPGKLGQGMNFDGTDDYVTVADAAVLDATDTADFTLTGWFNRDTFTTDDTLIAKRNGIANTDDGYLCYIAAADTLICEVSDAADTDEYTLTSKSTFTATGWNHFAFVWDQDNAANTEIYINGAPNGAADVGTIGNLGDLSNAVAFRVGAESDAGVPFDGTLDEARMYNRALSATEIKALYDMGEADKVNSSVSQNQGTGRLDSGLFAYFTLDENTGTTTTDRSTNGVVGTLTGGPTWTTGQIGSAIEFDGTDDYVISTSTSNFINSQDDPHSGFAWVYPNSTATQRTIWAYGESDDFNDATGMYMDAGGELSWANNGTSGAYVSGLILTVDQWQFVGFSSAGGTLTFYKDGATQTLSNPLTNSIDPDPITIGEAWVNSAHDSSYWDGTIDEVRVYDRAVSIDEMHQLYRLRTPTGVDTGLKGYWSFNGQDMAGTTAYDRSGAGNTGTLTNGPLKVPGKLGQALDFNGTTQYVIAGSGTSLDDISNLTACAWIHPDSVPATYAQIVSKGGWDFEFSNTVSPNRLQLWTDFGTSIGRWAAPDDAVPLNAWSHVCVEYNDSSVSNDPTFYVNGVSVPVLEHATPVGTSPVDAASNLNIGVLGDTSGEFFDGEIDEVRVYSRFLSTSEIKALYDQGR